MGSLAACTKLAVLDVGGCVGVGGSLLSLANLKALELLDLAECHEVSKHALNMHLYLRIDNNFEILVTKNIGLRYCMIFFVLF